MTLQSGISAHAIILACNKIKFDTWPHMLACVYKTLESLIVLVLSLPRNALKFEAGS